MSTPGKSSTHACLCAGFFFGMRRQISEWSFDADHLFDPRNRNIGQEPDLFGRSQQGTRRARICLHTGAFAFHYKSALSSA